MDSVTIELPEDVASRLAEIAAAQHKSVAQIAVERLRSFETAHKSPAHLLAVIRGLPRPSAGAVDDLEAAIASHRLPVPEQGAFDEQGR
jgi:predicted transcriptional regulator